MINENDYMELREIITIAFQSVDDKLAKISQELSDFKNEVNERFDKIDKALIYQETRLNKIESNMVQKKNFNSLVKILERKEVISKYEAAHVIYPVDNYLNKRYG